jgi:phosphoglycolate phosphatase-like HAD superfamily hydrolase
VSGPRPGAPGAAARLALFDLDGTLTDTTAVDAECFVAALAEAFAVADPDTDWHAYPHCTDAAIARVCHERRHGRPPSAAEVARLRRCFVRRLRAAAARSPERFAEIRGARRLLPRLRASGWGVAVATGGWGASARLKLALAGLDSRLLLASSDEAAEREEIVRIAVARAAARAGVRGFDRVVLVGDGRWDVVAAARLGLPFVGVAAAERAVELARAGARRLLPDLADAAAVLAALAGAAPPAPGRYAAAAPAPGHPPWHGA